MHTYLNTTHIYNTYNAYIYVIYIIDIIYIYIINIERDYLVDWRINGRKRRHRKCNGGKNEYHILSLSKNPYYT